MWVARFAFQACAFNHSAISPSLESMVYGRVDQPETPDCDRPANLRRSLTGREARRLKISPLPPSRPVETCLDGPVDSFLLPPRRQEADSLASDRLAIRSARRSKSYPSPRRTRAACSARLSAGASPGRECIRPGPRPRPTPRAATDRSRCLAQGRRSRCKEVSRAARRLKPRGSARRGRPKEAARRPVRERDAAREQRGAPSRHEEPGSQQHGREPREFAARGPGARGIGRGHSAARRRGRATRRATAWRGRRVQHSARQDPVKRGRQASRGRLLVGRPQRSRRRDGKAIDNLLPWI